MISLSPTLLPAPRRNLLGRRFKDDRELETVVTLRVIAEDSDFCQREV